MTITLPKPVITAPATVKLGSRINITGKHEYTVESTSGTSESVLVSTRLWIQFEGAPEDKKSDTFDLEGGGETSGTINTAISWTPTVKNNYLIFAVTKVTMGSETKEIQQQSIFNAS